LQDKKAGRVFVFTKNTRRQSAEQRERAKHLKIAIDQRGAKLPREQSC